MAKLTYKSEGENLIGCLVWLLIMGTIFALAVGFVVRVFIWAAGIG